MRASGYRQSGDCHPRRRSRGDYAEQKFWGKTTENWGDYGEQKFWGKTTENWGSTLARW